MQKGLLLSVKTFFIRCRKVGKSKENNVFVKGRIDNTFSQSQDFLRTVISIDLISLKIQILRGKVLFKNPGFEKGKEKKKNGKKIDPTPLGFEPQIFEQIFPAQDLNFEGD